METTQVYKFTQKTETDYGKKMGYVYHYLDEKKTRKKLIDSDLLEESGSVVDSDLNYITPLHVAAACGNLHLCQHVIKKNCEMPIKNKSGCISLHYAAYFGHTNVFRDKRSSSITLRCYIT